MVAQLIKVKKMTKTPSHQKGKGSHAHEVASVLDLEAKVVDQGLGEGHQDIEGMVDFCAVWCLCISAEKSMAY